MRRETIGFMVIQDDEQGYSCPLSLETGPSLPKGGLLGFGTPFVFLSRKAARAAINRTHHYDKAFEGHDLDLPAKAFCRIHRVEKERPAILCFVCDAREATDTCANGRCEGNICANCNIGGYCKVCQG